VNAEVLEEIDSPEGKLAAARSRAYGALAQAFEYPDDEYCEDIRAGTLRRALQEILSAVDPGHLEGADWPALEQAGEKDELAVEFTRLFDVGSPAPPCPLCGGLYGGARMKTMEEVIRFYNHFGLTMAETPRELPDHLTTELEFLHFLAFREAEALQRGEDADSFRRAQRDFIARHPGHWIPKLLRRLESQTPMPFLLELVRRIEGLLERDLAHLVSLVGAVPIGKPGSPPATGRG
jgi:DMSO reductase family type II enzyme chaperone